MDCKEINVLSLAYIGDSVYELKIREYLIGLGYYKVNKLQKLSLNYVTAKKQCEFVNYLLDNNLLSTEEKQQVLRGRNASTYSHPKNTDILVYKWATGFECLFGFLHINGNIKRIDELIKIITEV